MSLIEAAMRADFSEGTLRHETFRVSDLSPDVIKMVPGAFKHWQPRGPCDGLRRDAAIANRI
jgi:hypothetical protein